MHKCKALFDDLYLLCEIINRGFDEIINFDAEIVYLDITEIFSLSFTFSLVPK